MLSALEEHSIDLVCSSFYTNPYLVCVWSQDYVLNKIRFLLQEKLCRSTKQIRRTLFLSFSLEFLYIL